MSLGVVGQRCVSEREPELGLGLVARIEPGRIAVTFPATQEQRLYALGTPVLKRVQFLAGETVATRGGKAFAIEEVVDRLSPEVHPAARAAKDCAAGAVLIAVIAAVALGIAALGPALVAAVVGR